jgi:hypothetical protein
MVLIMSNGCREIQGRLAVGGGRRYVYASDYDQSSMFFSIVHRLGVSQNNSTL